MITLRAVEREHFDRAFRSDPYATSIRGRTNQYDRFVFHPGFEKHNRCGVTARHPQAVLLDSAFAVLNALVVI